MFDEKALWGAKSASAQSVRCPIWCSWTQFFRVALSKERILAAVVLAPLRAESGILETQSKAIDKRDFGWSPSGALVILPGIIPTGFLSGLNQVRLVS